MYAIIATGGKQYRVSEGDTIYIEKLENEVGEVVTFPVMMLSGETIEVGNPYITGATVTGNKAGHRQPFTQVEITGVNA